MSLLVNKAGIHDTIQDHGRYGYGKWGINPGGYADVFAAQVANALVGNELHDCVIEMHFPASVFTFQEDAMISLTGANFKAHLNDTQLPCWKAIIVKKGSILSFHHKENGYRCYLAVHGGFNASLWLGSYSTDMKVSAGGMNGKKLKKGDQILFRNGIHTVKNDADLHVMPWSVNVQSAYKDPNSISFTEGKEWSWLTTEAKQQILSQQFAIDASSDRMGYSLNHEPVQFAQKEELLSSAVSNGTIQALPRGTLLVLMADHQTTGGYPRIGHVITAHQPKLAQRGPGEILWLNKISVEDAEKMLFSLAQDILMVQRACKEKLDGYYAQH
jgi:antagonist of KipI